MKSQALQQLFSKIYGNEETRRKFQADPGKVLARYHLTEQEKRAVLKTHTNLGLVTSGSDQLEATLEATLGWGAPLP